MAASDHLLRTIWEAVEHTAAVEAELRAMADELAGWRAIAQAACTALERALAHGGTSETLRERPQSREHRC